MQLLSNNNLIRTEFSLQAEWEQGFTGKLDLLNLGETIQDWQIEFESAWEIEPGMIWGAEIVSHEGDKYVLKPIDYNDTINSQQQISISFNANKVNGQVANPTKIFFSDANSSIVAPDIKDKTPEPVTNAPQVDNSTVKTPTPNPDNSNPVDTLDDNLAADIDFTLIKDWGSGFQGEISITNNTGSNIDSWTLEFDFPNRINNIWDAEIKSSTNGNYVISNAAWNREISAGETLTFGFTGDNSVSSEPQNFDLDGSTFASPSTGDSIYTFSNADISSELQLNQNYQGRATFYDAANPTGGKGASGYDVPTSDQLYKVVAINNVQWNGSEASGGFFEVSGPKQREGAAPIIVQVVDYLYERADGMDMSAEAFERVANPVDGVVNINYQLVGPGDDYVTAYGYSIGQGIVVEGIPETNPYYAAVRLNNHRYPLEKVELLTENGNAVELNRESDNRFVLDGNYPLYGAQDLQVTDIFGQQVTLDDVNITNSSNADIVTGEQFAMIS
ncbi:MAG: expansin EXLX1 family cellulose-binding protein [Waterburya sp.]